MFHVVSVTFSDANFSYIPIVMTMKLCLSDIYVEWHKIIKGSYSEIENLQRFRFMKCHGYRHYKNLLFLFLTKMFYGAKH